jgi:alkylhydroperoxidase/carboxymuconolactone decarboxylase family protein YurZ
MTAIMTGTLPELHPGAGPYVEGIARALYPTGTNVAPLAPVDRERCVLALLAARGGRFTLAMHVYVGLMEGLAAEEVAHILLLAGVYAGIGAFADGLQVLVRALAALETLVAKGGPLDAAAIVPALRTAFPD